MKTCFTPTPGRNSLVSATVQYTSFCVAFFQLCSGRHEEKQSTLVDARDALTINWISSYPGSSQLIGVVVRCPSDRGFRDLNVSDNRCIVILICLGLWSFQLNNLRAQVSGHHNPLDMKRSERYKFAWVPVLQKSPPILPGSPLPTGPIH